MPRTSSTDRTNRTLVRGGAREALPRRAPTGREGKPAARRSAAALSRAITLRSARSTRSSGRTGARPRLTDPSLLELRLADPGDPHWTREVEGRRVARIRLRSCRTIGRRDPALLQLVEVTGRPEFVANLQESLRRRPELRELSVARAGPSKVWVRTVEAVSPACALVLESGAFCTSCRFLPQRDSSRAAWTVVVPSGRAARPIFRALGSSMGSSGSSPFRMRRFRPSRGLTARQALALEAALRLGYYAFPRRARLSNLGRVLGVSRSTASELLRRAEAKALSETLSA